MDRLADGLCDIGLSMFVRARWSGPPRLLDRDVVTFEEGEGEEIT